MKKLKKNFLSRILPLMLCLALTAQNSFPAVYAADGSAITETPGTAADEPAENTESENVGTNSGSPADGTDSSKPTDGTGSGSPADDTVGGSSADDTVGGSSADDTSSGSPTDDSGAKTDEDAGNNSGSSDNDTPTGGESSGSGESGENPDNSNPADDSGENKDHDETDEGSVSGNDPADGESENESQPETDGDSVSGNDSTDDDSQKEGNADENLPKTEKEAKASKTGRQTYSGKLDLIICGSLDAKSYVSQPDKLYSVGGNLTDSLFADMASVISQGGLSMPLTEYALDDSEENRETLQVILQTIINDTPSYFYFSDNWGLVSDGGTLTQINWNYADEWLSADGTPDKARLNAAENAYEQGVQLMLSDIRSGMSTLEKVLAVHERMVEEIDYDMVRYTQNALVSDDYTAYGAFVNRTCVCQGYAVAFQELMGKIGVECKLVTSRQLNHAWNLIKLSGSWYHVDVTWDDPIYISTTNYNFIHGRDNFLCSDSEIWGTGHGDASSDWYTSGGYPKASNNGSYSGYVFRQKGCFSSYLTYQNGYWYLPGNKGYSKMKIDGSDVQTVEYASFPGYYAYCTHGFQYEGTMYCASQFDNIVCQYSLAENGETKSVLLDTMVDYSSDDNLSILGISVKNGIPVYGYQDKSDGSAKYYRKHMPVYITSMYFPEETVMFYSAEETKTLTPVTTPEKHQDTITYTSSDTAVVTVNNKGVLTPVGNGTATITAVTLKGVTAQCTVTCQIAGKVSLSLTSKPTSDGISVILNWEAAQYADTYCLYRESLSESRKLIAELPKNTLTYTDLVTEQDTYTYYIQTQQTQNGTVSKGFLSEGALLPALSAKSIRFTEDEITVAVDEHFTANVELLPQSGAYDYEITYESADPAIVSFQADSADFLAHKQGKTTITATASYDGQALMQAQLPVNVVKKIDEQPLVTEDLYVVSNKVTSLADIALPQSIRENYDWKYPTTKLAPYKDMSPVFACVRKPDRILTDTLYEEIKVKVHVTSLTGFQIQAYRADTLLDTPIIYLSRLSDAENASLSRLTIKAEALFSSAADESGQIRYEYQFTETSKLGLRLSDSTVQSGGSCDVWADENTKSGTASVKVTVKAYDTIKNMFVKSVTKTLRIDLRNNTTEILLLNENGTAEYSDDSLAAQLSLMTPEESFYVKGMALPEEEAQNRISIQSGDSSVLKITTDKSNPDRFLFTVKGYGSTIITAAVKNGSKQTNVRKIAVTVKDTTPKPSDGLLTVDKNKTTGAQFDIFPSYGCSLQSGSVKACQVLLGKKDVTDSALKLFSIQEDDGHYTLSLSEESASADEWNAFKPGTYTVMLQGRWLKGASPDGASASEDYGDTKTFAAVKVKVTNSKPAISLKQTQKINLFYASLSDDKVLEDCVESVAGTLSVQCKNAKLLSVRGDENYQVQADIEDGAANGSLTPIKGKTAADKATIYITCEGYKELPYTLKVKKETKQPAAKLSSAKLRYNLFGQQNMEQTVDCTITSAAEAVPVWTNISVSPADAKTKTAQERAQLAVAPTLGEGGCKISFTVYNSAPAGTYKFKVTPIMKSTSSGRQKEAKAAVVSLVVKNAKPTMKLEKSKLKLNAYRYDTDSDSTAVSLSDVTGAAVESITFTPDNANAKKAGKCVSLNYGDGLITAQILSLTGEDNATVVKKGSYRYKVTPTVRTLQGSRVTLPAVKVTVDISNTAPTAAYSASTVTINQSIYRTERACITATLQNAGDAMLSYFKIQANNKNAKNNFSAFQFSSQGETLQIGLGTQLAKGSYTFYVTPVIKRTYEGRETYSALAKKPITVKIANTAPSVSVSAKGSIDLLKRDGSFITYTGKLKNITGEITDVTISGVDAEKFRLEKVTDDAGDFNGQVRLYAKDAISLKSGSSYSIILRYRVNAGGGSRYVESRTLKLKPKQTSYKVSQSAKTATFYQSSYEAQSASLTLTAASADIRMARVAIADSTGAFTLSACDIQTGADGKDRAGLKIKLTHPEKVTAGKSYTVKFQIYPEGLSVNGKPTTVSYKITVKK